ncbi:hypothetical protein O181_032035 [Austropuccinia psidii MF-1]|uniref:Exonuclease V n=1 Tax=Austropuccinia psidii MF-1 TaxID=1389203 RepID=A0A9Q3D0A2_9BASI|nr:hypothetical protein [Austropuccinia psidii MF-1]
MINLFRTYFFKSSSSSSSSFSWNYLKSSSTMSHSSPILIASDQEQTDQEDFNEPEWNQTTLNLISAIESNYFNNKSNKTKLNHIKINLDSAVSNQSDLVLTRNNGNFNSLFQRFRSKRGFLSVSDLVSCIWCETQVEYGLLGKRYLRPSKRPTSIRTANGIEIQVNQKLVMSRQKILDRGTSVHTKLEKQVAPEKVPVEVVSPVDEWGLKVVNTMVNLNLLLQNGMMREISVWGFIGDFLILGIIDQIELISANHLNTKSQAHPSCLSDNFLKTSLSRTCTQSKLAPNLSVVKPIKKISVRISDSKTIQTDTLPPPSFTQSARYQLMLYKFLYDQMINGSLDVERLAIQLSLDLDEPFSSTFFKDIAPLVASFHSDFPSGCPPGTLREMFGLFDAFVSRLDISDFQLEIVYRKRGSKKEIQARLKRPRISSSTPHPQKSTSIEEPKHTQEIKQPQPAIQLNSLGSFPVTPPTASQALSKPEPLEIEDSLKKNGVLISKLDPRLLPQSQPLSIEATPQTSSSTSSTLDLPKSNQSPSLCSMRPNFDRASSEVIGSLIFSYDESELQNFALDALKFWNGEREAIGVPIDEFNRCQPCEFKDGCEWRAKKSQELIDSVYEKA